MSGTSPDLTIDHEFLCRGIHFIVRVPGQLTIECSWCDETGSVFHTGETFNASLQGRWIAKATEHLVTNHLDKVGLS